MPEVSNVHMGLIVLLGAAIGAFIANYLIPLLDQWTGGTI